MDLVINLSLWRERFRAERCSVLDLSTGSPLRIEGELAYDSVQSFVFSQSSLYEQYRASS